MINQDVLLFFAGHMGAFPLYERLEERLFETQGDVSIKVQKSQISFYNKHMFACVSFSRPRRKKDCPENYIVLTLGLGRRLESPRVDVATEPYPKRWTHHFLISSPEEIDEELMAWIDEAADFARNK